MRASGTISCDRTRASAGSVSMLLCTNEYLSHHVATPDGWPVPSTVLRNGTRYVWMAIRPGGGVSITDRSRTPASDICNVRGMGVAVIDQHVDAHRQLLQPLLVCHAEALLLIDDQQAQIA